MFSELTVNESCLIDGGIDNARVAGLVGGGFGILIGIGEIASGAGALGGAVSIYCGVNTICTAMNW